MNCLFDDDDVRCVQCGVIIGQAVGSDIRGIYIRLDNIRLSEIRPIALPTDEKYFTLAGEQQEVSNHLKRKFEYEDDCDLASKYVKPNNNEPIVLMRALVQPEELEPENVLIQLPEFDADDYFSELDEFDDMDIDIDNIIPFIYEDSPNMNLNMAVVRPESRISVVSVDDDSDNVSTIVDDSSDNGSVILISDDSDNESVVFAPEDQDYEIGYMLNSSPMPLVNFEQNGSNEILTAGNNAIDDDGTLLGNTCLCIYFHSIFIFDSFRRECCWKYIFAPIG